MIERLWRRLAGLIFRGVVVSSDSSGAQQSLTVRSITGESSVEHVEPYGFTSRPLPGGEAIVIEIGAAPDCPVAIITGDRRSRPTDLAAGDVSVYGQSSQSMTITTDKIRIVARYVEIVTDSGSVVTSSNGVVTGLGVDPYTGQTYASIGATTEALRVEVT